MVKISKSIQDKENLEEEEIEKDIDITPDQLILKWKFQNVDKKLTYDIKKCVGCSLCKIVYLLTL